MRVSCAAASNFARHRRRRRGSSEHHSDPLSLPVCLEVSVVPRSHVLIVARIVLGQDTWINSSESRMCRSHSGKVRTQAHGSISSPPSALLSVPVPPAHRSSSAQISDVCPALPAPATLSQLLILTRPQPPRRISSTSFPEIQYVASRTRKRCRK